MKEHGIIFQGWGVRAIQNCKPNVWPAEPIDPGKPFKRQTRRIIKPQPTRNHHIAWIRHAYGYSTDTWCEVTYHTTIVREVRCPYGIPGDRLWVRETWDDTLYDHVIYRADYAPYKSFTGEYPKGRPARWKPSIYLPRKAARLILDVHSIRVERVQEISEEDARAEGVEVGTRTYGTAYRDYRGRPGAWFPEAKTSFGTLWDSINAKPKPVMKNGRLARLLMNNEAPNRVVGNIACYVSYPWEEGNEVREHRGKPWYVIGNPWVWRVEFSRVEAASD